MSIGALLFHTVSSVQRFSWLSGSRLLSRLLKWTLVMIDGYFQQRRMERAWSWADCTRIVLVVKLPGVISFLSPFSM